MSKARSFHSLKSKSLQRVFPSLTRATPLAVARSLPLPSQTLRRPKLHICRRINLLVHPQCKLVLAKRQTFRKTGLRIDLPFPNLVSQSRVLPKTSPDSSSDESRQVHSRTLEQYSVLVPT